METCYYCGAAKQLKEITKESPSDALGRGTTLTERYLVCRKCYEERTQKPEPSKPAKPRLPNIMTNPQAVVDQIL